MCLLAGAIEQRGMSTVALVLLRSVAEKVCPPRALYVPFRHGYPLDAPGDPRRQHAAIEAALQMLEDDNLKPPAIVDFVPEKAK